MILADSSIWIEHFRRTNPDLEHLLLAEEILMHPFIRVELALGSLRARQQTLVQLGKLDEARVATNSEVLALIEAHRLYSRGIGFVDVHLLASCLLTPGTRLWTRDRQLSSVAGALHCAATVPATEK